MIEIWQPIQISKYANSLPNYHVIMMVQNLKISRFVRIPEARSVEMKQTTPQSGCCLREKRREAT